MSDTRAVGIDFGTTNSTIAIAGGGHAPQLARFPIRRPDGTDGPDGSADTTSAFRSLIFFEEPERAGAPLSSAGPAAIEAYLETDGDGRLLQSLKSFLASRLFTHTEIYGTRFALEDLVAIIVDHLRAAAEEQFGASGGFDGFASGDGPPVVVGRPIRFVNAKDDADDALAVDRLRAAFSQAGIGEVTFEYEPVAAAYFYESTLERDELILIGDLGGGTSDFSLVHVGPGARDQASRAGSLVGTAGVAIAGDDLDAAIVRNVVAPAFGRGTTARSPFGGNTLTVPKWIYGHLERWNHLSFLRSRKTLQLLYDLTREAEDGSQFEALLYLVREELGFQLYRSVQATKAALSIDDDADFAFVQGPIDIRRRIARAEFEEWIAPDLAAMETCLDGLLADAGTALGDVDRVFLTGGTSQVPAVDALFERRFGRERLASGDRLTSVAAGLALRAAQATRA